MSATPPPAPSLAELCALIEAFLPQSRYAEEVLSVAPQEPGRFEVSAADGRLRFALHRCAVRTRRLVDRRERDRVYTFYFDRVGDRYALTELPAVCV